MLINGVDIINSVARHEAAHWLTWKLHGGEVEGIEFTRVSSRELKGAAVIRLERKINSTEEMRSFIRARIITLWSGVYAQSFDGSDYNPELMHRLFLEGGGRSDHSKAHEYLHLLRNITNDSSLEELHHELDQSTANLVADNFTSIVKIANHISDSVSEFGRLYMFDNKTITSSLLMQR